jgi:thiol-disulfide isomerase/thioredoxin
MLLSGLVARSVSASDSVEIGRPAPPFRLPVYNAKVVGQGYVGTSAYLGDEASDKDTRLLVVSFMASFCAPCKKELPELQRLFEAHRGRGLRVLAVAIDGDPEGQAKVAELVEKNGITFPVLKDRFNIVARRWLGPKSPLPSLFLVGRGGTIQLLRQGYASGEGEALTQIIESALEAAANAGAGVGAGGGAKKSGSP